MLEKPLSMVVEFSTFYVSRSSVTVFTTVHQLCCPEPDRSCSHIPSCAHYHILCTLSHLVHIITSCAHYHILCTLSHLEHIITSCAHYHILCTLSHLVHIIPSCAHYPILCTLSHLVHIITSCAHYHILCTLSHLNYYRFILILFSNLYLS